MRKIKYASIGFGGIVESRIAKEGFGMDKERFDGHPLAELVGVTDINPARKEVAESLGLRWYDSISDVLSDAEIDAVFIGTNNLSHVTVGEMAMEAGKHCLFEKPMATTVEDAIKLQKLSNDKGLSLAIDHMMTENSYNKKAKELIQDGSIGQVSDIVLHMEFCYGSSSEEAATWRCANPLEVGGPIGDVGSHCLYMAEFLLGSEIESLACVYTPKTFDIAVENGAFIQFRAKNGTQGTVRVAFNQPRGSLAGTLNNLGYEVYGTEGTLRSYATLFQLSGYSDEPVEVILEIDKSGTTEKVKIDKVQNIYQGVITKHAQSIIDGSPMDGSDAVHNMELIFNCFESADKQNVVSL